MSLALPNAPFSVWLIHTRFWKCLLPLYKNIFFWIIMALLVIVFFGSGLIIRTIIQEVNLLNLKSEFIASVSHEFKTQLTAMGTILERFLSDEVKDSKKTRDMDQEIEETKDLRKRQVDKRGKVKYKKLGNAQIQVSMHANIKSV